MKIVMELLSDGLPDSGIGLTGFVDRDICCDKRGLPLIPAKRIRGVLRETASELEFLGILEKDAADRIFGVPGQKTGSFFRLDDGKVENAEILKSFLDYIQSKEKLMTLFSPRMIIDYYSYIRAQTRIEDGVAKENSLRVSRVLRKGLKFHFPVECPNKYREELRLICRGVHAFGASRNRGLGEVRLLLKDTTCPIDSRMMHPHTDGTSKHVLSEMTVTAEALGQMLVSDNVGKGDETNRYIPGTFLLGALAGRYLTGKDSRPSDDEFRRFFLSGDVIYTNLYPIPQGSSKNYLPAPLSIKKIKDKDEYVDLAYAEEISDMENNDKAEEISGNLTGYVALLGGDGERLYKHLPNVDMQYHHRRPDDRSYGSPLKPDEKEDCGQAQDRGTFFQFETIGRDQFFKGTIIGSNDDLNEIAKLFPEDGILRFGKSKAGQYGKCRITLGEILQRGKSGNSIWEAGDDMVFQLTSDMILLNENGHPEPNPKILLREIAMRLDLPSDSLKLKKAFAHRRLVGGYLGVWNLPRVQYPALEAGSVLIVENRTGKDLDMNKAGYKGFGLRVEDGFGRIEWNWREYECKDVQICREKEEGYLEQVPKEAYGMLRKIIRDEFLNNLKEDGREKASKAADVTGSFISRIVGIIGESDSFDTLNGKLAGFKDISEDRDKPAYRALKKIQEELFINELKVDKEKFKKKAIRYDPIRKSSELQGVGLEKVDITEHDFCFYREYALAFLTALKLKNRKNGSVESEEVRS